MAGAGSGECVLPSSAVSYSLSSSSVWDGKDSASWKLADSMEEAVEAGRVCASLVVGGVSGWCVGARSV